MTINWRLMRWGVGGILLLLPLAAMQITNEVAWTALDFAVAAALMGGALGLYELVARGRAGAYRAGAALALLAAFLSVWINGAVGIVGSEDNPANWLFVLVPAVAPVGMLGGGFRPDNMARAMLAAGAAQFLVGVAALAGGFGAADPSWPYELIALTAAFAALWFASAWAFLRAARG